MKSVLIIAAHPDDEVLGCGGIIAKFSAEKKNVHVALLTGGVLSRHARLSAKAKKELELNRKNAITANKILGVTAKNIHFLKFEDQRLDTVPQHELIQTLRSLLAEVEPDMVFCHHPGDYNKDHRVAYEAVLYATRVSPGETCVQRVYTYEVLSSTERSFGSIQPFVPNTYVDITSALEKKMKALATYTTELHPAPHPRSILGVDTLARHRGMEIGTKAAEAFHLVRSLGI